MSLFSYIKPQQVGVTKANSNGCISLFSYIKPQRSPIHCFGICVVYLCFPTSNRNMNMSIGNKAWLYIFVFLHQTATEMLDSEPVPWLYIFVFLHQTATAITLTQLTTCCISLFSYIKPQLLRTYERYEICCISLFSYIKPQLY